MTQRSIMKGLSNQLTVTFSQENTEAINDIVISGRFGSDGEEVVLTALSLLYNIFRERSDARVVIAQGPSGRTVINL